MGSTVFTMMFVATAPIVLLPTWLALFSRHRNRYVILAINLAVWGAVFLLVVNLSHAAGEPVRPVPSLGAVGILIVWLLLLRFALTAKRAE